MKLKTNWHFAKWDGLNILFVIQYIRCFRNFWGSANALLQLPLKMVKKLRKFWVQHILWSSKILFCFLIEAFFFQMVIFATLFRRFPTLWKWTLKMITLFRRYLTLFNSTLKNIALFQRCKFQRWRTQRCFSVDLTLCDVATWHQPKNNVEPTVKCLLRGNL